MRRVELPLTKIIATLGPASASEEMIARLIEAGVSIFRINFSHGTAEDHRTAAALVRRAVHAVNTPVAILGDLPGPKIRVAAVPQGGGGGAIEVNTGDEVIFESIAANLQQHSTDVEPGSNASAPRRFAGTYRELVDDVQAGQRVLINDGAVRLLVVDKRDDEFLCRVMVGGLISEGKGINLPDTDLSIEALTPRDRECVAFALEHEFDFIGLSFVRTADEVARLRDLLESGGRTVSPAVVAKIEHPRAVENIDSILEVSDAIMIARGDLGVEMELARVPVIQKQLIEQADAHGRPCIVATQMLESMISNPTPTRAEMNDVANAILDDVDAVMLSGETAVGQYPALAVEYMRQAANQTEAWQQTRPVRESAPERLKAMHNRTAALAHGVWTIVQDFNVRLVIVWSQRGGGARMLSQNNLRVPIIAISSDEHMLRRMQLLRGVMPVHMTPPRTLAEWTRMVDEYLLEHQWARQGEQVLLVAGSPLEQVGNTNAIAVHEVGSADTGFARFDALVEVRQTI